MSGVVPPNQVPLRPHYSHFYLLHTAAVHHLMMLDPATNGARRTGSCSLSGFTSNQTIFFPLKQNAITLKGYVSILFFHGLVFFSAKWEFPYIPIGLFTCFPLCVGFIFNVCFPTQRHLQPIWPPYSDLTGSQQWCLYFQARLLIMWRQLATLTLVFRVLVPVGGRENYCGIWYWSWWVAC